jgi:hypothetical protein
MNIMFAQAILQKESMRCGFVTGHDRGTLWVACRKCINKMRASQAAEKLNFSKRAKNGSR